MRAALAVMTLGFILLSVPVFAEKRLTWEQPAPVGATVFTGTQAQAYVYKYYRVGGPATGTVVAGPVVCLPTNDGLIKTCSAVCPIELTSGMVLQLTASDPPDESARSNQATMPPPPGTPTAFRVVSALARAILSMPGRIAASLRR